MEALSRREETEVIDEARAIAMKVCDDSVRGESSSTGSPSATLTSFCRVRGMRGGTDFHLAIRMPESVQGHVGVHQRLVSRRELVLGVPRLPLSMTTERLDSMKLDYISKRSEKGRAAVEALRESRQSISRRWRGRRRKRRLRWQRSPSRRDRLI